MKKIKDNNLDIMFYDASDWAGEQLRFSWVTGGHFYKLFRGVEETKGCYNWTEALNYLSNVDSDKKIKSIQFWGHGSPGRVWINGDFLSVRSLLASSTHRSYLLKLKERLTPESVIWFRSCNVFAGQEGYLFAIAFSQFMNCVVAGHTFIVGPWQSGLHTIKPGERPSWSKEEGIKKKENGETQMLWSKPWSPNTIFCLTGQIPKGW